jgi:hypothetical protein
MVDWSGDKDIKKRRKGGAPMGALAALCEERLTVW